MLIISRFIICPASSFLISSKMSTIYSCSSSPKVVSFSKYSEVTLIPKEDIYTSKKWYSPNDRDQFYQNLNEDIKRASRDIAQQSLHHRKYECVGIDVFLTEGLAKRLLETKRAHVHAVLSEQNRQRERGFCDMDKLADVSKKTSWTRDRARTIATGYWLQYLFGWKLVCWESGL